MNTTHTLRSRILGILAILAVIILALSLPTPLHDWFVAGHIGPVPADVAVMALIILITPVTILSTILRKFDVDYEDETSADTPVPTHLHHGAMQS